MIQNQHWQAVSMGLAFVLTLSGLLPSSRFTEAMATVALLSFFGWVSVGSIGRGAYPTAAITAACLAATAVWRLASNPALRQSALRLLIFLVILSGLSVVVRDVMAGYWQVLLILSIIASGLLIMSRAQTSRGNRIGQIVALLGILIPFVQIAWRFISRL